MKQSNNSIPEFSPERNVNIQFLKEEDAKGVVALSGPVTVVNDGTAVLSNGVLQSEIYIPRKTGWRMKDSGAVDVVNLGATNITGTLDTSSPTSGLPSWGDLTLAGVSSPTGSSFFKDGGTVSISSGATNGANAGSLELKTGSSGSWDIANDKGIILIQSTGNGVFKLRGGNYSDLTTEQIVVHRTSSTSATAVQAATYTLAADSMIMIEAFVTARRTGGSAGTNGDSASYKIAGTYKKVGAGAATIVGAVTVLHSAEDQAAWDATFTTSGDDVRLTLTGAANNNIKWRYEIRSITITT